MVFPDSPATVSTHQGCRPDFLPRVVPFVAFLSFIALGPLWEWASGEISSSGGGTSQVNLWLYPVKTLVVGSLLLFFWTRFRELQNPVFASWGEGLQAIGVGLLVYYLWVQMDWPWAIQGELSGYEPFQAGPTIGLALVAIRIFGASIVVPIMEELFWRSFLIRYIIHSNFESVRLGTFTAGSFLFTVVLFGLEHNLWLAGMMAGAAYNALLYRTGRLWPCIIAHAITNLALGIHVLITGEWHWW